MTSQTRSKLRVVVAGLGVLFLSGLLGVLWWQSETHNAEVARAERLARLAESQPRWSSSRILTAREACDLVAWHALDPERAESSEVRLSIAVDCDKTRVAETSTNLLLVERSLLMPAMHNVIFGGGFTTAFCVAYRDGHWQIDGPAWRLDDCKYEVRTDSPEAVVAQNRKQRFLEHVEDIRTVRPSNESACPQVVTDERYVGVVMLPFMAASQDLRLFQSRYYETCTTDAECHRSEPPGWVVVVTDVKNIEPQKTEDDTFVGGHVQASLMLFDARERKAMCKREFRFEFDEHVVTPNGVPIHQHWRQKRARAFCDLVAEMSNGALEVDSHHCP